MEKTQLKEKVQKHVDSLFLTLSQNLDVQVSEDVQNRFTNWLSQEAFDVLLAQKKQGLIDATEQMFTELQNDLGMTFREQTKSDLLEILLAEAGVSFEDSSTEIKPKDASSDKPEIHSEEKSEAEANAPQVADETVQEADKVTTNENTGKPWTEECHDPEIIQKVNGVFAQYFAGDFGKGSYSRDMNVLEIYNYNRQSRESFRDEIEELFDINLGGSLFPYCFFWDTMGDIYDSVLDCLKKKNCLKKKSDEQQTSGEIDKQKVYGVKKLWGDYKVDPSDSSPKVRKIVDMVNQALVVKLGIDEMHITRESRLKDDLGADSLDSVEFIMECEKAFNFYIPEDVSSEIQTVGDAYDCLYYYLKG